MRKEWTTSELKRLADLYAEGLTRKRLAEELGRPWSSIKGAICAHKMKRDKPVYGVETITGVGGFICAAHRDKDTGKLHGHTWDVEAWFKSRNNAVELKNELQNVLNSFDHTELPEHFAWGEELAAEILRMMPDCCEVKISRNSERIYAKAMRRGRK